MNGNISSNIIVKPIKDAGTKVIGSFARQGEEIIQEVLNTPQQQEVVSPAANEAIANSTFVLALYCITILPVLYSTPFIFTATKNTS